MKKRTRLILAMFFAALPLYGIGDLVFDPTSYNNAVLMMGELVKSFEQLQAQLNLQSFLAQVVPVDMASRYRAPAGVAQQLNPQSDRFNNLSGWTQALNQGAPAGEAYNTATIPLASYGSDVSRWPQEEQNKLASQYASIELADGTNIGTMQTIGQLRANARATDQALASLEADSLSSDPSMNTEIGVLNKIDAAGIAQIRASRDSNLLMLEMLEQQLAEGKLRRDAAVGEMNAQIGRMQQGAALKSQYTSTVTQSIRSFRWQ